MKQFFATLAPGAAGFLGALTLPQLAAAASGFAGAAWFCIQIYFAVRNRYCARPHCPRRQSVAIP